MSIHPGPCLQDIAGELEESLSVDKLLPASASNTTSTHTSNTASASSALSVPPGTALAATSTLIRCLGRAASADLYMPPLADKFLRLALQLAQRYAYWIAVGTAARKEALAAAAAGQQPPSAPQQQQPAAGSAADSAAVADGSAAGGAGLERNRPAGSFFALLPAEDLGSVISDALLVAELLRRQYSQLFADLVRPAAAGAGVPAAASEGPCPAAGSGAAAVGSPGQASAVVLAAVCGALGAAAQSVADAGQSLLEVVAEEVGAPCITICIKNDG